MLKSIAKQSGEAVESGLKKKRKATVERKSICRKEGWGHSLQRQWDGANPVGIDWG